MYLDLESGPSINEPTEVDILSRLDGEEYAILSAGGAGLTYMQCAVVEGPPRGYELEYQDGSLDEHYRAADAPIPFEQVVAALLKYLHGDESWRDDFRWEKMDL